MGCNTIFYSHWIQGTQSNLTCAFFLNLPWLYNLSSVTLKGTWTPCISGVVHFILRHCCKSGNLQRVRSKPYRHIWKLLPSQVSSAKDKKKKNISTDIKAEAAGRLDLKFMNKKATVRKNTTVTRLKSFSNSIKICLNSIGRKREKLSE